MIGWTGVDLDGTLAHFDRWRGPDHIGAPLAPMVERVRVWLAEGRDVRIVTARVASSQAADIREVAAAAIASWTTAVFGRPLPATAEKDMDMLTLWDDRCVQVLPNVGRPPDWLEVQRPEASGVSAVTLSIVNSRGDVLRVDFPADSHELRDEPLPVLLERYLAPALSAIRTRL